MSSTTNTMSRRTPRRLTYPPPNLINHRKGGAVCQLMHPRVRRTRVGKHSISRGRVVWRPAKILVMSSQFRFTTDQPADPLRIGSCQVYVGTCSWADPNFVKEGGFYPKGVRSDPAGRLRFYSTVFPTVEVDATYHALQPPDRAAKWVEWTPEGFIFTVKAFSLFTWHETAPRRLPPEILALLPEHLRTAET